VKKNHKGFSLVELLIVIVVVGCISAAGWFVFNRKNNQQNVPVNQTTEQVPQSTTYTNDEFSFSFYHPNPKEVTVTESGDLSTIKGKRYEISIDNETSGSFVTSDWATNYDADAGKFKNCLTDREQEYKVVTFLEEDGLCVKAFSFDNETYGEYDGSNATLVISKKFGDGAKIKALTFKRIKLADKPYTESTLREAYASQSDAAIKLARSIKEL
jgi:prepilin-type N-terminal cleavage/methylation domain-containing protein